MKSGIDGIVVIPLIALIASFAAIGALILISVDLGSAMADDSKRAAAGKAATLGAVTQFDSNAPAEQPAGATHAGSGLTLRITHMEAAAEQLELAGLEEEARKIRFRLDDLRRNYDAAYLKELQDRLAEMQRAMEMLHGEIERLQKGVPAN